MFTKIVRLILLRDMLQSRVFGDQAVWEAERAARFVLKGETPERPAPRPDVG